LIISSIVAMGLNRVIGKNNKMMWHIPSEYDFFQKCLGNHYYLIGRKNYEGSLNNHDSGRAIVLSRDKSYVCNSPCFQSIDEAIDFAKLKGEEELFVLGGEEIYRLAMGYIDRLYLSIVDFSEEGDSYFPSHSDYNWKELNSFSEEVGPNTPRRWEFKLLQKI